MNLRHNFISDLGTDFKSIPANSGFFHSRLPFISLQISPSTLSPDGSAWLHVVEATKRKSTKYNSTLLYLRVITNEHRGVNIIIDCNSNEMLLKYQDLRFQIRNSDHVLITFPVLSVCASKFHRELYLKSTDFKILDPNSDDYQK